MLGDRVRRIVDVSTTGLDPDRYGIGSGPALGDAYRGALFIPQFRPPKSGRSYTLPATPRFLFLLCGIQVPEGERARLLSYRMVATIAQVTPVVIEDDPGADPPIVGDSWNYVSEREVVTPLWSFTDGNIAYGIRVRTPQRELSRTSLVPGGIEGLGSVSPGLLYSLYDEAAGLYVPPAGGQFPGGPIGSIGTLRDTRNEWQSPSDLGAEVQGPCTIQMFASVLQTDPLTRPYLPANQQIRDGFEQGLRPEDQFLNGWGDPPENNTRYRHIAAAMRVAFLDPPKERSC